MQKINFTKMVASGNDFVVIKDRPQTTVHSPRNLAQKICDRRLGVGADGLLLLGKSKKADVRMRIFNADGSEAEMCGNGARCTALYISRKVTRTQRHQIQTKAGIISAQVSNDMVKIKLTDPKDLKLDIPIKIGSRTVRVNFINTGVPHAVVFVEGLDKINVPFLGSSVRYHKKFSPPGVNVDFVEILENSSIRIRTYERGVEDETLACGTGSVASALITSIEYRVSSIEYFNVYTSSGEILKVYFNKIGNKFENVWLEGKARIVHKGVYYV